MENLIEEIKQEEIPLDETNQKLVNYKKNKNINSAKSQKLYYSTYTSKYAPIYIKKEKIKNIKPKRKYETFIVENTKNNYNIDFLSLIENIEETQQNITREKKQLNDFLEKKNKTLLWYQILNSYDSYNNEKELKSISDNKNKIINKNDELISDLDKMNEKRSINKTEKIDNNKKIKINNYKDVLKIMIKEVEKIRKEREKEYSDFIRSIEMIEEIYKIKKYKTPKKQTKEMFSIYLTNINKKITSNKFNTDKNNIKNKKRINSAIKNKNPNKNIHKEINNSINKFFYTFNGTNKYFTQYLRNQLKKKNKANINIKTNPKYNFYQKIINEMRRLNKENEQIKQKYKNIYKSESNLLEKISKRINKKVNVKSINYRRNKFLINKNIDLINKKIIDDLLYECLYDIMIIDTKKRDENNNKKQLISGFNNIFANLNLITEEEKNIITKYDEIMKQKESKSYINNYNLIPIKRRKIEFELNNEIIKRIENNKYKILENMILNGCFYSDYNIFEIYDDFIDEQINLILEDEINHIVNKYELLVEKVCDDELKRAEREINE